MALVTRFVNTASSAGGDGTTNGTSGATRAYASLNEWEAAEQTNLVTDGDTHLVHCEGSTADTAQVVIVGWTTGVSNGITVQVDSDKRHDGNWDTSAYRLSSADTDKIYQIREDYVDTTGLQVEITTPTNLRTLVHMTAIGVANAHNFSYMIIRGNDVDAFALRCFVCDDADGIATVYNSLLYNAGNNFSSYGFNSLGTHTVYNVTIANCRRGIRGTGTWTEKNVLITIDGGTECWYNNASHARDYCAGNDATANEQGGTGNRDSQTFTFVGAEDFHLHADDTGALGHGVTDPGSGLFSDDIDGDTRTVPWDIGFDEFVAIGIPASFDIILADIVFIKQVASDTVNIKQVAADTVNIVQVDSDTVGL